MHPRRPRALTLVAAALGALIASAPAAADKSFSLPQADVVVQMANDGTLHVDERIEYRFSGSFSGGYREIPLRARESIDNVSVREGGRQYRPGGCTELGCSDAPDTFGVASLDGRTRIVWHYRATNEARTFELHYDLHGLAVAYDDVVEVNLDVWGDEWKEGLGRLTATLTAPGRVVRAWGHPVYVRGDVHIAGKQVVLRALGI